MEEVRKESERQMEDLLVSYQSMQLEMMRVREEVLTCHQKDLTGWETIIAEREVLLEKVQLWESRYEELRCLFEAKLSSKEETINLLTLKIGNLEMGPRKICHCIWFLHYYLIMKATDETFKGFLVSCDKNREKEAVKEASNFLQEVPLTLMSILKEYTTTSQTRTLWKRLKKKGKWYLSKTK